LLRLLLRNEAVNPPRLLAPAACCRLRRLDLDHVGALIAEDHRPQRPRDVRSQIDDAKPMQRTGHAQPLGKAAPTWRRGNASITPTTARLPCSSGSDHVEIVTDKPEETEAFYTRVLGFRVKARDRIERPGSALGSRLSRPRRHHRRADLL